MNDDSVNDGTGTCTSDYDNNSGYCGNYDTADFISATLCCVCGGGTYSERKHLFLLRNK